MTKPETYSINNNYYRQCNYNNQLMNDWLTIAFSFYPQI